VTVLSSSTTIDSESLKDMPKHRLPGDDPITAADCVRGAVEECLIPDVASLVLQYSAFSVRDLTLFTSIPARRAYMLTEADLQALQPFMEQRYGTRSHLYDEWDLINAMAAKWGNTAGMQAERERRKRELSAALAARGRWSRFEEESWTDDYVHGLRDDMDNIVNMVDEDFFHQSGSEYMDILKSKVEKQMAEQDPDWGADQSEEDFDRSLQVAHDKWSDFAARLAVLRYAHQLSPSAPIPAEVPVSLRDRVMKLRRERDAAVAARGVELTMRHGPARNDCDDWSCRCSGCVGY
jgi:hypothetical protein